MDTTDLELEYECETVLCGARHYPTDAVGCLLSHSKHVHFQHAVSILSVSVSRCTFNIGLLCGSGGTGRLLLPYPFSVNLTFFVGQTGFSGCCEMILQAVC